MDWKRNSPPPVDPDETEGGSANAPSMIFAIIPILAGVLLINFAGLQPIYGLGLSAILSIVLFWRNIPKGKVVSSLNEGFANGVMPLIMVTAVVGIAQVVSQTDAFNVIRERLLTLTSASKVGTAFSVVGITNVMALICGSASGAIAMTLEMFSDAWIGAGIDVWLAAEDNIFPALCNSERACDAMRSLASEGHLGLKTGKGFFDYPAETRDPPKRSSTSA